ncbi:unnamed protein product, partial [Mesorhabditis belari]|uniref:Nudix hydrolase domain-containing protein n=1 Tax=Mesorhabditis belari TaxID=2138241 RepID=A0AAF3J1M8_9BILA
MAETSTALQNWSEIWRKDFYNGITLNTQKLNEIDPNEFENLLPSFIENWKEQGIKTVWMKVPKEHSILIPILTSADFEFHHAQPKYLMMTKFLPNKGKANLPTYPFTQIGVGGITVDDEGRFLMMREKQGIYLGWKFPGGLMDPGESLLEAAAREVKEETGVDVEGVALLGFRHMQNLKFGIVADLYFVVVMRLKPGGVHEPKPCVHEAAAAAWLSRKEIDELNPDEHATIYLQSSLKYYDEWRKSGLKGLLEESTESRGRLAKTYYFDYTKVDVERKGNL